LLAKIETSEIEKDNPVIRGPIVRTTLRLAAVWLASVLLLAAAVPTVRADSQELKDIRENPLVEEVSSTPETETRGWQSIYGAYSCVYDQLRQVAVKDKSPDVRHRATMRLGDISKGRL
jgi:hypothetical protein